MSLPVQENRAHNYMQYTKVYTVQEGEKTVAKTITIPQCTQRKPQKLTQKIIRCLESRLGTQLTVVLSNFPGEVLLLPAEADLCGQHDKVMMARINCCVSSSHPPINDVPLLLWIVFRLYLSLFRPVQK